jgi:hypothetical protein
MSPPPFHFDIRQCIAFDLETYSNRWCVGFHGHDRRGNLATHVVDGDVAKLRALLERLASGGRALVGYNSARFDVPAILGILRGDDPHRLAQSIIREQREKDRGTRTRPDLTGFPCDHIDLAARLTRMGVFPSLKVVAAYLGRPMLRELPHPPDAALTDEQWEEVKHYNASDLAHTWALLEWMTPELQALAALSQEVGRDLRSTPTPRVCELVFRDAYRKEHGVDPRVPEPPQEVLYRPVAGVMRPRTAEAAAWFDRIANTPLPVAVDGGRLETEVPQTTFSIGALRLTVGAGGLHSVDRPMLCYDTGEHRLLSVDVASYYPSLIATRGIAPRSYGDTGASIYRSILTRRLEIKRRARTAENPAERERLGVQADALKLILNSTFGKFGDTYSSLFDPGAMLAVTLSGQLLLIDLIERLAEAGVRVISANTDGLFILAERRQDERCRQVLEGWQRETEMTLEVEQLERLAILATNRFATLDAKGRIKCRGDGLKGSLSPLAAPNSLIVNDAVVEALLHDVPPERTVWACTDPVRFCWVTRTSSKAARATLLDEKTGEETELPKVVRWYKGKGSTRRIRHRLGGDRHTTPANASEVELAMDLTGGRPPEDLDRGWYIGRARKEIQSVEGYRHREPERLGGHGEAGRLLGLGLTPVPKWAGKALPPGSDPKAPTLLWAWDRARTLGCFTGPKVATLVLDIDEPALFKKWVDKGNSPLLADRWRDLEDCLVSVRGESTADHVRTGRGRGKLIFRLEADEDHPLARISVRRWLKTRGVEVFYGQGMPSILGDHPSGEQYRLEGTPTEPPAWLIEGLSPNAGGQRRRPRRNGRPALHAGPSADGRPPPDGDPGDEPAPDSDATIPALVELRRVLEEVEPLMSGASVGWRRKDLGDGRVILVGRCPFEHASGTTSDGDLSAGFNRDGGPYVRCFHSSCTAVPDLSRRLAGHYRRARAAAADAPDIEPTAIAEAMLGDLGAGRVALHRAPTGSGKSHAICQAAVIRYRQGLATAIVVPTLRIVHETRERILAMAPDLAEAGALALVCGRRPGRGEDSDSDEAGDDEGDGDDGTGQYPIHEWTRIVITTHAAIGRRGFSKFIRPVWSKLGPESKAKVHRPACAVIVDEVGELIQRGRQSIELHCRYKPVPNPDRTGGKLVPLRYCPMSSSSGNCLRCDLEPFGGDLGFDGFGIRVSNPPRAIPTDSGGNPLRKLHGPLTIAEGELALGEERRVDDTTFAAAVVGWRGNAVDRSTRRTAATFLFRKDPGGKQQPETVEEVIGHMLGFAFRPVLTWELAVDTEGNPVPSEDLKRKIGDLDFRASVVWPHRTCEVRRLQFDDLYALEVLRRFSIRQGVGVLLVGAAQTRAEMDVLSELWPDLACRDHPYPQRKIRQAAVILVDVRYGVGMLPDDDGRLLTHPLEAFGKGLIFCPTRRGAERLFKTVQLGHPSARLAVENEEQMVLRRTLHRDEPTGCYITYSRGVMGLGANVEGVRFVVVDATAFRAAGGFNPAEITPEAFRAARGEERVALLMQNLGRALRGEEGKTVVLFVLRPDQELEKALRKSRALLEGCALPPVFGRGKELAMLVDQARRWLEAGGGDWPPPDPGVTGGKRTGRKPRTRESILQAAEDAIGQGMSWRQFARAEHPKRQLSPAELADLKARFEGNQPDRLDQAADLSPKDLPRAREGRRQKTSRVREQAKEMPEMP